MEIPARLLLARGVARDIGLIDSLDVPSPNLYILGWVSRSPSRFTQGISYSIQSWSPSLGLHVGLDSLSAQPSVLRVG